MKSRDARSQSTSDLDQFEAIAELFSSDPSPLIERIEAFPKYTTRQSLAKFLTKYELFKRVLHVNGSFVECGVLHGGGLFAWAKLSSIFEPSNHVRKIIGFDTFEGFPNITEQDTKTGTFGDLKRAGLTGSSYEHIVEASKVYDLNRPIAHIPKIELVKGDLIETAPRYIEENPHLVVALLYLDVDLYAPTKIAIETFVPRMPKGSVIVFDELNARIFPGETMAVLDTLGLRNLRIERFPFDSYVSFATLE